MTPITINPILVREIHALLWWESLNTKGKKAVVEQFYPEISIQEIEVNQIRDAYKSVHKIVFDAQ